MIFHKAMYYKNVQTGEDVLGNPIFEKEPIGEYLTAITQWKSEEIALLDREVTQNSRKMLSKAPISVLKQSSTVSIDSYEYADIKLKSDFKRWRLCYVEEWFK